MVVWLRNYLYCLQLTSLVGYGTFNQLMISYWFVASRVDGELFMLYIMKDQITHVAAVNLCMDELLFIASEGLTEQIQGQMKKRFLMNNRGSVSLYLSINIERQWEHHTITLHQGSYIRTMMVKFHIDESRPVATPMVIKIHKSKQNEEACDRTISQSIIGCLM